MFIAVIGALSVIKITPDGNVEFGDTFIPSATAFSKQEDETLDLSDPYLVDANANRVTNEFSESSIDPEGFYLRIDAIDLFKAVVEDVDPRSQQVYKESWEKGISHGKFTAKPDQIGLTYFFAHAISNETRIASENAWFTHMDKVGVGDEVIIYYKGSKYTYEVSEVLIVEPTATGFYTGASPVPKIRMQFCGPPTGSLQSRTLVDALLIDVKDI